MWTIDRIDGLLNLATIEEEEVQTILNYCDWPDAPDDMLSSGGIFLDWLLPSKIVI